MTDPNSQPAPAQEQPVAAVEDKPKVKKRASDRLNIPSSLVRACGFVPGDKVFVADEDPAGAVSRPCLVLLKEQPPKLLADYAVAQGHRIRVTPAMLKKCGLEGGDFELVGGQGKIVIKPQKEA